MSFHNKPSKIPTGNYKWARQTDPYGRVHPSKQEPSGSGTKKK